MDECKPPPVRPREPHSTWSVDSAKDMSDFSDSTPSSRGLHSFTLELNLSNSRIRSGVKSGYTVDRRAQAELNWERV